MLEWLFGKKKQQPSEQKKKKTQAEDKWMYDFMVQYLSSPIWRVSILDFVDNKCIVFDNQEENKFQYTTIHNVPIDQLIDFQQQFKELVGNLVDGMMEQIGMSQEKLAEMIQRGFQSKQHRKIFNQLLLADDFLRFKELMLKRNKALEQEAIAALQAVQQSQGGKGKVSRLDEERNVIKESQKQESQRLRKAQQQEEQELRKALEMSRLESQENNALKELQRKVEEHEVHKQQEKKQQQKKQSPKKQTRRRVSKQQKLQPLSGSNSQKSTLSQLPPLKAPIQKPSIKQEQQQFTQPKARQPQIKQQIKVPSPIKQQKLQEQVVQSTKPAQTVQQKQQKPKQQSLQERKQRLMAQREKIRKQKQQQRKKQMEQQLAMEKQKMTQPSSNINTIVLQQDGFYDNSNHEVQKPSINNTSVPQDELKRRKQLMNKIKNRIIDDF